MLQVLIAMLENSPIVMIINAPHVLVYVLPARAIRFVVPVLVVENFIIIDAFPHVQMDIIQMLQVCALHVVLIALSAPLQPLVQLACQGI